MVAMEETQPLPMIERAKFTLEQLRMACGMSQMQVAEASGVRLCRVVWIEGGIKSSMVDILLVIAVYSRMLGYTFQLKDITGVKVQEKTRNAGLESF